MILISTVAVVTGIFLYFAGYKILNPTFTAWLNEGDHFQHYIGQRFFQETPMLQWPLGANPNYGMEISSSIVFSDSLPLFAFPAKFFRAFFPSDFQYFGLWVLCCLYLQAFFSYKLIRKFTKSQLLAAICSLFFVASPPMLCRFYGHEPLMAHWVILAGLYLYFSPDLKPRTILITLLSAIAVFIHFYLLAIVWAIFIADLINRFYRKLDNIYILAMRLLCGISITLLTAWAVGYFMVGNDIITSGYGYYKTNLLSIFDCEGIWSKILPNIPYAVEGEYEGFAYMGSGMLVLLGISLILYFKHFRTTNRTLKKHWPILIVVVGVLLFACSNQVAFGPYKVLTLHFSESIQNCCNLLRSSGRMVWLFLYCLYLFVFYFICKYMKTRNAIVLCLCLLSFQLYDTSNAAAYFRNQFNQASWPLTLSSDIWMLLGGKYSKIRKMYDSQFDNATIPIARFAAANKMTIDFAYLARIDQNKYIKLLEQKNLTRNKLRFQHDTIYIDEKFPTKELFLHLMHPTNNDFYGEIDTYRILVPHLLSYQGRGKDSVHDLHVHGLRFLLKNTIRIFNFTDQIKALNTIGPVQLTPHDLFLPTDIGLDTLTFILKQFPEEKNNIYLIGQENNKLKIKKFDGSGNLF